MNGHPNQLFYDLQSILKLSLTLNEKQQLINGQLALLNRRIFRHRVVADSFLTVRIQKAHQNRFAW